MGKMQAVVEYDAKDFRYEEVDKPVPGPGDVLLKIEAAGVCASDRYRYFGGDPWTESLQISGGFGTPRAGLTTRPKELTEGASSIIVMVAI